MSEHGSADLADDQQTEQRLRDYIAAQHRSRREANGAVTLKDVCQLLEGLGLPFEEGEVKPLLADWSDVSLEACIEAITTVRITHNAELDHIMQRVEEGIIRLSLIDYIKYRLPCFARDPSWQHRTIELSLNLAPRQVLFISTGVVLLVAGMSILLLMSLLWLRQANDREVVQMENFHLLLHAFSESFERRFLDVHAATMVDEADTLAKMLERQHELHGEDLNTEIVEDVSLIAGVVMAAAGNTAASLISSQLAVINTLRGAFLPNAAFGVPVATLSEIVSAVETMNSAAVSDDVPWLTIVTTHDTASGAFRTVEVDAGVMNCAYGPCDYAAVPCVAASTGAAPPSASGVMENRAAADVRRDPVVALFTRLDNIDDAGTTVHVTVCSMLKAAEVTKQRVATMAVAIHETNAAFRAPLTLRREVLLARWSNASAPSVEWLTPLLRFPGDCYAAGECYDLDRFVQQVLLNQARASAELTGYTGTALIVSAAPLEEPNMAVVITLSDDGFHATERAKVVSVANRMNSKATADLEISIGYRDPTTGAIDAQLTEYRYASDCLRPCSRTDAASAAAKAAITTQSAGYVIAPNYQPVPVLAAYSFLPNGLDLAIVVERQIVSIRQSAIASLVAIFNANNAAYTASSLETQLVSFVGYLPTKTYDPSARCDQIRECERDDAIGVVYRSDCVHCSRLPDGVGRYVQSLTALKYQAECERKRNCTPAALATSNGLWRRVLDAQNVGLEVVDDETDYRDIPVLAVTSYVTNLSVGIIVKIDKSETRDPILRRIGIASGVALAIVLLGLVVLIFFSRKVLDSIEHEWLTYKDQIDAEKKKFDAMVKDVLPAHMSEELRKTQKLAMPLHNMSFIFLDVVGMSDRTKNWAPELVCRYITYIFTVVDKACSHYSLNKVRVFGDTYFAVGGLGESSSDEPSVFRAACFGSVVVQLLGPRFAHFPDEVPLIRDTFADYVQKNGKVFPDVTDNPVDVGHITMPPMRVGMHCGIGTFCIIETGRTPAHEVLGPGVALAFRLQATSMPNRIHISESMKEMLERLDRDRLFDFDPVRKTVVKGQGTVGSLFVRSASVVVPQEILTSLGIEYSNRRVFYEGADGAAGAAAAGPAA